MEIVTTTLAVPNQEGNGPASPTPSQAGHHRKNHRGGARERARRERKASGPLTPSTPSSAMSSSSSVSGARKHNHRAGIKYKAKRERQALYKMTSDGMEPVDASYDSEDQYQEVEEDHEDDGHSEHDAPSLTYDSDEHEEENEVHEVPDDIFKPNEVQEIVDSKVDLHSEQDTLAYHEKVEAGVEVIMKGGEKVVQEEILVAPSPVAIEKSKTPVPSVTLTPPKKQPIKLLSLMRPKVL